MNRSLILALIASIGLVACSKTEEPAAKGAASPRPAGSQSASMPNTGKVAQVLHAGTYSYVEVEGPQGQKAWLAGGHLEAKAGDMVQWGDYSVMRNFEAKSLGRKFDQILFVANWRTASGAVAAIPPQHGAMPGQQAQASAGGGGGVNSGQVKSATNAGGYSYIEVAQGSGSIWLAVPETKVKAGDKVSWSGGATMQNFNAKSLNRTFEKIVFAGAVTVMP